MGTSWSDQPTTKLSAVFPRLSGSTWSSEDSFDERSLPASPKPKVERWVLPEQGSGLRGLRALISLVESSRDGYDAIHHSAKRLPKKRPSELTLAEIFAWIDATPRQHHAIGFYQIIPSTLKRLVADSGVAPTLKFTPELQDYFGDMLIAEAGFNAFVAGKLTRAKFMDNLARIWAGLPMAHGRSAYHGKAGNRAVISRAFFEAEMARIFGDASRSNLAAQTTSRAASKQPQDWR